MAESMIERVARAILKRRYYDCEPEAYGHDVDEFMRKLDPDHLIDAHEEARSAIEAMREPTDAMVRAMIWQVNEWQDEKGADQDVWYAPIDAALNEQVSG